MKVKDIPYFDRPREKLFARGAASLSDEELMMIILGSGIKGKPVNYVAKKVVGFIKERMIGTDGFEENFKKYFNNLKSIDGVGFAKASLIIAAYEFFFRCNDRSENTIISARDIYPLVNSIIAKKQEHLIVFNLNGRNRIISKNVVTVGLIDQSLVHPREIYSNAIKEMAASIILVHNHPSGDLEPSMDDIKTTEQIKKAGDILGIPLLDHIIVSKNGYYSFKESHLL